MKMKAWLTDSLARNFPRSRPPAGGGGKLVLYGARGECVSFQACAMLEDAEPADVTAGVEAPDDLRVRIRRVGCVPIPHHNTKTPDSELDGIGHIPGYVPDVLYEESAALAARGETTSFWIAVEIPRDAAPGVKTVSVELSAAEERKSLRCEVAVSKVRLEKRRDFRVTHWFYADALCDRYGVQPFDEPFWRICDRYMENYAAHGSDTIYVPCFTPPLDGVKRPTQLLRVKQTGKDRYAFDWRDVKRWIAAAKRCGIEHFEWTHLFTQWGAAKAIRIYEKRFGEDKLLWPPETQATSPVYRKFLAQYLPALRNFLEAERLVEASFFHLSDEPHGDAHLANYRAAREMLRELAPWMKVMDALSDIRFAEHGLTDMPIPSISVAKQFAEKGVESWTYFCCGPRGAYLNRLMDTPLAKIRMAGPLFYRFKRKGFLHWGYNYWYKSQTQQLIDPFSVSDGMAWPNWAYGDTFVVYPGPGGPLDSIRWEVFRESLQDYALFQTLGLDPDGPLFTPLKDFNDFPKDGRWLMALRRKLLERGN